MADRRPEEQEMSRAKRHKTDDLDPKSNPYLAHMYESEESYNGLRSSNGFGSFEKTSLSGFKTCYYCGASPYCRRWATESFQQQFTVKSVLQHPED
jgi:hypothetical protein